MPLVRLQVRNEYGLGQPELYKETNREDPKAVLDGVAVAGLVGILRQLGDLADFAAEVFHGLQEQVLTTASRSHKLMLRAQNIEASLPPLEKAILTQTSHIHFAYTAGCEWHCRTKTAQNHFIYNDLPQFIMDSYEECRDPPRLHLLDKFDSGGPGSCLRRYSDPTFFKRASAYSDEAYSEKIERARKTCRSKKKRLSQRKGGILLGEQMHSNSGRMQFASHVNGKTSSLQTASPVDMMPKSDPEDQSDSFDSKTGAGYIECVFHSRNSVQPDEQEYEESSSRLTQKTDTLLSASPALDDNFSHDSFDKQIASTSTGLTWHEKEEIMDSKMQPCDGDKTPDVLAENQNLHMHEDEAVIPEKNHHNDFLNGVESNLEPVSSRVQTDEIDSEPDRYLDALNDIESESENDLDCEIKQEVEQFTSHITGRIMENGVDGATSTVRDHDLPDVVYEILSGVSINEETERDFLDSLQEIPPLISESHVSSFMSPAPSDVPVNIERTKNIVDSHASESPIYEQVPHRCDSCVLDCSVGTNPLDGAHTLNKTVSGSIQTDISSGSRSSDLPDKEADRDFPESLQEIPPPISELNGPSIRSPVPSDVPVNIERTKNLADSHASESPIMEQVPHISENSVLDCSVGTNPLGSAHTLNDTASVSIETDISSGSRSSDLPDKEADRDFPESLLEIPPLISEPHGTSLRSPVSSDVPVKIERTKNLADSHASESPITEQVPHISGNSVLDCSIGTNPLGGAHTLNYTVSVSFETDISSGSRISDLPDKEADRHFPESLLEIPPLISEPHGTGLRSPVSSDVPVKIERTKNLADSHTSESPITEHLPHISGNSVLDCSVGTNPLGGAHTLNDTVSVSIETDISSGSRSSDLPDKEADRINSNICKFEETPSESAIDHSISLWTNGGLLGLEPSKPPDFIMSSSLTSINVTGGPSNHNSMLKSNGYEEEQDLSAEVAELKQEEPSSRCSTSHSDEQACISVKTSDCHHLRNGFGQKDEEDLDKIKVLAPGNALPVADNTRAACTEPNQGSRENSPLAFRLSHRSLINSFRRKVSFDEKSGPDNSLETGILELSGQNSIVHQSLPETPFKEQVSCGYTIDTPPPSPPLEHMKISFHPIIKVETSKLKLKFPDGSSYHESTRDVFPSFQLVPELFIPLHDSGSNSDDDDTFCRSSPYVSDDCLSPHSDYNSDQWESGDTSDSSYPGVYDSSHRISLTESKFSSQDIRGVTNVDINLDSGHSMYTQDSAEPSLYGPLLDFPSFDTMNFVLDKEYNKYSDYKNNLKLQSHAEPTPPPFPPKQWGESNLQLDMMNEMQNYISEDSGQINDPNILESTLQLRPSQVEQNKTDLEFYDDISCNLKDKLNQQNLNGQKKENQVGTGKDTDEREDFLQQIRTKSFNLRHTVTGKPSASTGPATNGKVTAILEKVNAIRQVVTSDDGEDDNWSDT